MKDARNLLIQKAKAASNVAILMSGEGSNARALLRNRDLYPRYEFVALITDNVKSNAEQVATEFDTKVICSPWAGAEQRNAYFTELAQRLDEFGVDLILYAGFMKIAPDFFVNHFMGINMHPSDLTLVDSNNKPKFVGLYALEDMLLSNLGYVASTAYVVDASVDCGPTLATTEHLQLENLPRLSPRIVHKELKAHEHLLYPKVLQALHDGLLDGVALPIAEGRLTQLLEGDSS